MRQVSTTVPIALLLLLRKTNVELCWIVLEKHQLSAGSEMGRAVGSSEPAEGNSWNTHCSISCFT